MTCAYSLHLTQMAQMAQQQSGCHCQPRLLSPADKQIISEALELLRGNEGTLPSCYGNQEDVDNVDTPFTHDDVAALRVKIAHGHYG